MRRVQVSPEWYLIPALALVVVLPLMLRGCSCGHDFDFHLVSWMEAAAQFRAGNLHPSWAFSPGWNAGEPRFVFYPPISWTLGGLLGMAMPWAAVPIVYTWLALLGAGVAMYHLASQLTDYLPEKRGGGAAAGPMFAAAAYVANPYMVFTAYERTAYAELLAAVWIPLLLAGILRRRVTVLGMAMPVALLWLTNAPAAVMGCYSLGVVAAVRIAWTWRERRKEAQRAAKECGALAGRVVAGAALGLGLAAFYILPAAYERRWVQIAMAMISGMRIEDNFLFHHTGDGPHDEVLHTASMIAVAMLAAAAAVLIGSGLRRRGETPARMPDARQAATRAAKLDARLGHRMAALAVLAGAIGFLLTPWSAGIWRVMPEMAFLQFPWRFTAVLAAVACGGLGMATGALKLKWPVLAAAGLAVAAGLSLPAASAFRQECDDTDTVAARVAVFAAKTGTDPTDEYTPTDADNDSLAHGNPPFWFTKDHDALTKDNDALTKERDALTKDGKGLATDGKGQATDGEGRVADLSHGTAPMHFGIDTAEATAIVLNLRDYPAWVERVNGAAVSEKIQRDDGLIAFAVPAGHSQIDVDYRTTWDHALGDGISLVSLCGMCGWIGITGRRRGVEDRA